MPKKQNNDLRVNDLGRKQTHSLKNYIKVDVVACAWNPYMLRVYKFLKKLITLENCWIGE